MCPFLLVPEEEGVFGVLRAEMDKNNEMQARQGHMRMTNVFVAEMEEGNTVASKRNDAPSPPVPGISPSIG